MKGLCYKEENKLEIIELEKPKIKDENDVIVELTFASICTSDLHITKGKVPRAKKGVILGHEGVGIVREIGSNIKKFKPGDHVSINCITFCGECWYCKKGFINNCSKGGWELGCRINGTLANYVRVPFGDSSLNKIPLGFNDEEFLFVGDALSSGYFGVELGEVKQNDFVAVIGCGPVGLCSMICCKMQGAKVIGMDINEKCLNFAKKLNLCDFYFNPNKMTLDDLESEIKKITDQHGCDCTIENAGTDKSFEMSWRLTRPNGIVSLVAMYESNINFPLPFMYGKNLIFKTGGVDAIHCDELINKIKEKKINTMDLITHRFNFNEILEGVNLFFKKPEHCVKISVKF